MRLLTLKSVLAATDLGGGSWPALRTAARLARLAGAELHLLHVADAPDPDDVARLREEFERAAPGGPEQVRVQVLPGAPADVIVDQAIRLAADAIVLGPHQRGPGAAGEMGSTAASVVRTAPCPCLVAATELRLPLERVLAPIDLSAAASGTLAVALSWASALRPPKSRSLLTALHVAAGGTSETATRALKGEVERARGLAGGAARVEIQERITSGPDTATSIIREAASEPADLLVIGTRDAVKPASGLGSVSAAVALDTPCPLLLVPPEISTTFGGAR